MTMSKYTTLRKRVRFIARLAADAPFSYETMDSIGMEAHLALRDIDEMDTAPAKVHELKLVKLRLVEDERKEAVR